MKQREMEDTLDNRYKNKERIIINKFKEEFLEKKGRVTKNLGSKKITKQI